MKDKLLEIINHYGIDKQLKYIHSEYFELDEAIITKIDSDRFNPLIGLVKFANRISGTKDTYVEHIAEELADITCMLKQFQYYYGISDEEIEKIMKEKVNRQLDRIEKEKMMKK